MPGERATAVPRVIPERHRTLAGPALSATLFARNRAVKRARADPTVTAAHHVDLLHRGELVKVVGALGA